MPILGCLSEFPLPEVLLLIGVRTGKLRLLDISEASGMELDLSLGEVQALHVGDKIITQSADLLDRLSEVVMAQTGMFDFKLQPVITLTRPIPLTIHQLVITLVCHVDHQIEKKKTNRFRYELNYPCPEVWVEPSLNDFLIAAQHHLTAPGAYAADLAAALNMDLSSVAEHLQNLWSLGILRLSEDRSILTFPPPEVDDRSNAFLQAVRLSSKLPAYTGRRS